MSHSRRPTTLTPLVLLLASALFASIGNGIAAVALPWLVLERTGSAASASFVAAAASIPLLFATIVTGTIVDRIGRRTTAVLSDLLSGLSIIAIPVLDMTVGLSVVLLSACAALGAVFDPAGVTARETMLPEAAAVSGWRLDRVNSIYEAVYNASYLIGPGLGGLLIATIGADTTLFVTGAGFALSLATVAGVKLANAGRPVPVIDAQGFWESTREGLSFVWRDPVLRATALLSTAIVGLWMPIQGIILPAHYTRANEPGHLGWVLMSISAGGLTGSLAYGQWSDRFGRRVLMIASMAGYAVTTLGMAFLPPIVPMLLLGFAMGVTYGPEPPIVNHAMQTRTPERLRGRVTGAMSSFAYAAGPLGYLLVGPLIDQLGLQAVFFIIAGLVVLLAVATVLTRPLSLLDGPAPYGDEGATLEHSPLDVETPYVAMPHMVLEHHPREAERHE